MLHTSFKKCLTILLLLQAEIQKKQGFGVKNGNSCTGYIQICTKTEL